MSEIPASADSAQGETPPSETAAALSQSVSANTVALASGNARYTDTDDMVLVDCVIKHRGTFQTDSGFRPALWPIVLKTLLNDGSNVGGPKTSKKVADYFGSLKKSYINVKWLRNRSGFGWDEGLTKVTATQEVWKALLDDPSNKKKYGKWQNKPFRIYDKMAELIDGIYATGVNAISGGDSAGPPPQPSPGPSPLSRSASAPTIQVVHDKDSDDDTEDTQAVTVTPGTHLSANDMSEAPIYAGLAVKRSHTKIGRSTPQSRSVDSVAGAINRLSGTFENALNTPKRRRLAIKKFEEDGEMSDDESTRVYRLFQKDISIADTFVEIGSKQRRTNFLRSVLYDME
ncbi:hypothetical protein DFH05DRAFT_1501517 [Lentinula detonsa]|uniref:Myb/SANT-like domain-containing protein n=2 Tax=Lentinula detonsa TaxID=2804962 RepID=A0A9W8NXI7_9AGAR|nr:hypothetical protein DFH05DRAFT_1501517 [Lentinula detonsa]